MNALSSPRGLWLLDASHLIEINVTKIGIRRGHYLRDFAYRFIETLAPKLTESVDKSALSKE